MTTEHVEMLKEALKKRFEAEVEAEQVGPNGRYRFAVVSRQFEKMPRLDRQDRVWDVVDEVLPREATLDISLILAYAPDELEHAA